MPMSQNPAGGPPSGGPPRAEPIAPDAPEAEGLELDAEDTDEVAVPAAPPSRPELFATMDHRAWLAAWFAWKKSVNPRFSHRLFARLVGVSSPSLLLQVMQGRRNLTEATVAGVIKAAALDPEEAEYFAALVELDAAETADDKARHYARISAMRRFQAAQRIEGESFRYLSSWHLPAIRELATLPTFEPDPAWIAARLRPPIPVEQAAEALDTLASLGFLRPDASGRLSASEASLVTPREVATLAVRNYHLGMIARAADSIEAFPPALRHLCAVTVTAPDALLPILKAELSAFQARVLDLCASAGPGDRVMQINLQLFPLSAPEPAESP